MENIQLIPQDWYAFIEPIWPKEKQKSWSEKIAPLINKKNITPVKSNIFRALEVCSVKNTRVVILGQDPYPTFGHAHGLAFSTEDFVQPFPKSLLNIFKELKRSVPNYTYPMTGNLTSWAEQGVLLLNTCLTTEVGTANAHKGLGWEEFTLLLLQRLFDQKENLVGMFWGNQAQVLLPKQKIESHLILSSSHPSPLSVYRGFDGCNHFHMCNDFLGEKGQVQIDWQT
jgi:uracil-DNA glycosylase